MKTIYEYTDYREFLRDFVEDAKARKRSLSIRNIAKRLGFASHSSLVYLLNGQRNLTPRSAEKIIEGLKLDGKKGDYFRKLVEFLNEKSVDKKRKFFNELNTIRKKSKVYSLSKNEIFYFNTWYYPIVRHLAVYSKWNGDWEKLAGFVEPPITKSQAQKAVEVLEEMKLLVIDSDGNYTLGKDYIKGDDLPDVVKASARKDVFVRGIEALNKHRADERFASFFTLSVGEESYNKVVEMFDEFKQKAVAEVLNEKDVNRIYQMIFEMFPVSKKIDNL